MKTYGFFSRSPACRLVSVSPQRQRLAAWLALALGAATILQGQDADERRRRTSAGADDQQGRRGNFNPQEMQARMATALRERLEITDDEEWKVVSERILKVTELRRATGGGIGGPMGAMFAGRGGPGGPGGAPGGGGDAGGRGPTRGGRGGTPNTELGQLQSAVRDKLPDAEIKARLDKLRESRKADEAKLAKAQEELRAVLTLRQEAVAVVFGLLP